MKEKWKGKIGRSKQSARGTQIKSKKKFLKRVCGRGWLRSHKRPTKREMGGKIDGGKSVV